MLPIIEQCNSSTQLIAQLRLGNGKADSRVKLVSDDSDVDDNHEGPANPHKTHESLQNPYDQDEEFELHSAQVSNPWTIAKINAPLRQTPNRSANTQPLTPARQKGDKENAMTQFSNAARLPTRALPSPERTQKVSSEAEMQSSSPEPFPYPLTARRQRADNLRPRSTSPCQLSSQRGALDTWVQKSQADSQRSPPLLNTGVLRPNSSSTASPETQPYNEPLSTESQIATAPRRDFISARNLPTGTPLSEIPSLPQRGSRKVGTQRRGAGINKPFISPVNDPTKVWFDTGSTPTRSSRTRSPPKRHSQNQNPDQSLFLTSDDISPPTTEAEPAERPPHPDLAATLAYESRKAAAMHQRKQQQALLSCTPVAANPKSNSPHTNRYNKAIAALTSTDEERSSAFEPGDARAYLLRHHQTPDTNRSGSGKSPSRAQLRRRTAMLPLESISSDTTTLELILFLSTRPPTDLQSLERDVQGARHIDDYAASGNISNGFLQGRNVAIVKCWEERLQALLQARYGEDHISGKDQNKTSIELDPILQTHLANQLHDG